MKSRKFKRGEQFFFQIMDDNDNVKMESEGFNDQDARNKALNEAMKPYAPKGASDDYKPLEFYQKNTNATSGFDSFSADGESYFSYSVDGQVYLISEGYSSDNGRDNGISSVEKNMKDEARFTVNQLPNGKWYLNLRAGNNQEIATSRWFDSEGDANAALRRLTGTGGGAGAGRIANIGVAAPPPADPEAAGVEKKKRKKRSSSKPKAEKIPISDGTYLYNNVTYHIHKSSGNGQHYFSYKNPADGKTILMNSDVRGYDNPGDAEAAIKRVEQFGPKEANYEGKATKNGKFWFYLKDDDGKNVAKSIFFGTEEDMQRAVGLLIGTGDPKAAAGGGGAAAPAAAGNPADGQDEYLPTPAYAAHSGQTVEGDKDFITFEQDGKHYFAWMVDGDVYMRSQGYTSEAGRDNGIESVKKNRDNEERYANLEDGGEEYVILKAGNNQEIARSAELKGRVWTGYRAAGIGAIGALGIMGGGNANAEAEAAAAAKAQAEREAAEAKAKAEADAKAQAEREAAEAKAKAEADAKAQAEREAAEAKAKAEADAKAQAEREAAEAKAKAEADAKAQAEREAAEAKAKAETDAKAQAEREAAEAKAKAEADAKAQAEREAAEAKAKAEADAKAQAEREAAEAKAKAEAEAKVQAEREAAEAKAKAEREASEAKARAESDAKAKADQEAANNKAKIAAAAAAVGAGAVGMAASSKDSGDKPKTESMGTKKKQGDDDDYMVCSVYENRIKDSRSSKYPEFISFKADNGEHYFALIKDGKVFLRSEGYTEASYRDNGIESVLKNKDNRDRYSVEKKRGLEYVVLKSSGGHEIARSCPMKSGAAAWLPGAAVAATAAAAAAPVVKATKKEEPKKVVETKKERVVKEPVRERETAAAVTGGGGADGAGCMRYWPWLLLLLLIPLLWWLFGKGCNTPTVPPVAETVTKTAADVVENVVEEVKEVVEEVKEVVKEEPKYEPPVSTKGNKALGY